MSLSICNGNCNDSFTLIVSLLCACPQWAMWFRLGGIIKCISIIYLILHGRYCSTADTSFAFWRFSAIASRFLINATYVICVCFFCLCERSFRYSILYVFLSVVICLSHFIWAVWPKIKVMNKKEKNKNLSCRRGTARHIPGRLKFF